MLSVYIVFNISHLIETHDSIDSGSLFDFLNVSFFLILVSNDKFRKYDKNTLVAILKEIYDQFGKYTSLAAARRGLNNTFLCSFAGIYSVLLECVQVMIEIIDAKIIHIIRVVSGIINSVSIHIYLIDNRLQFFNLFEMVLINFICML